MILTLVGQQTLAVIPQFFNLRLHLPTVASETFAIGRAWTWDYMTAEGQWYSSETYQVINNENDIVSFQMSTRYADRQQIQTHHRLVVDLKKCKESYRNPADRIPWSIKLLSWQEGQWVDSGTTSTLAFEEKFNCNPHAGRSIIQDDALFRNTGFGEIFQLRIRTRPHSSWFFLAGEQAGVQAQKDFISENVVAFTSRLRLPGEADQRSAITVVSSKKF